MKKFTVIVAVSLMLAAAPAAADSFANQVVSYDAGSSPAHKMLWVTDSWDPYTGHYEDEGPYSDASAALGSPDGITEGWGGADIIVSMFNPAIGLDQIVSIGEGGHLTLRLANYAQLGAGPEIGLFSNIGLWDDDYPNGTATNPVSALGFIDPINVKVSETGQPGTWVDLGAITPDIPTSSYTDAPTPYESSDAGLTSADFSQPFTGVLSDLDGLTYPQLQTALSGSGGGFWLDLDSYQAVVDAGLTRVGFIRFDLGDDGQEDPDPFWNFELDAVSVATGHIGEATPEPATMALLAAGALAMFAPGKRRRA